MTTWLYCRISHEEAGSVSIETQEAAVRSYAAAHCPAPVVVLADRDVSGGVPLLERPAGRRLGEAVRGDHVVMSKTDRAFRSVVDGAAMIDWCLDRGVALHLLDLGLDTSTPMGRAMAHVAIAFAELERHQISGRRRAAAATRRRMQLPTMDGRYAPLGWRIEPTAAGRRFAADPRERSACKRALTLRRRGLGWDRVAARLQAAGVPRRAGRVWTRAGVRRAALAAAEGFPLISADCRRWGSESGRFRRPRARGKR